MDLQRQRLAQQQKKKEEQREDAEVREEALLDSLQAHEWSKMVSEVEQQQVKASLVRQNGLREHQFKRTHSKMQEKVAAKIHHEVQQTKKLAEVGHHHAVKKHQVRMKRLSEQKREHEAHLVRETEVRAARVSDFTEVYRQVQRQTDPMPEHAEKAALMLHSIRQAQAVRRYQQGEKPSPVTLTALQPLASPSEKLQARRDATPRFPATQPRVVFQPQKP